MSWAALSTSVPPTLAPTSTSFSHGVSLSRRGM